MCTRERCTKYPQLGVNLKLWGDRSKLKKREVVEKVSEIGKGKSLLALTDYSKEHKVYPKCDGSHRRGF